MFEHYTDRARRVIFFGRYWASQYAAPAIYPEHLLMGLVQEDTALVYSLRIDSERLKDELVKALGAEAPHKTPTSVDLPLHEDSKEILSRAAEEARELGHRTIDVGHLLLGILDVPACLPAKILHAHAVTAEEVRKLMAEGVPEPAGGLRADRASGFGTAGIVRLPEIKIIEQSSETVLGVKVSYARLPVAGDVIVWSGREYVVKQVRFVHKEGPLWTEVQVVVADI